MLATELRAHLRVRSDAHALLHLPSGKTLPAVVSDISIGGAYLIRGGSPPFAPLAVGELIDIQLDLAPREFPLLVEAEVIRCEADGPGLAVRFNVYDDIAPGFMDFVTTEAMAAGVDVAALGTPLQQLQGGPNTQLNTQFSASLGDQTKGTALRNSSVICESNDGDWVGMLSRHVPG